MAHPFERLEAWQLSHEQTLCLYQTTRAFPAEERFGLTGQLRRAAASVSANIAEGSSCGTRRDFARYLSIAKKSSNEVAHWLILARDLGYLPRDQWRKLNNLNHRVGKVIWALRKSLGE